MNHRVRAGGRVAWATCNHWPTALHSGTVISRRLVQQTSGDGLRVGWARGQLVAGAPGGHLANRSVGQVTFGAESCAGEALNLSHAEVRVNGPSAPQPRSGQQKAAYRWPGGQVTLRTPPLCPGAHPTQPTGGETPGPWSTSTAKKASASSGPFAPSIRRQNTWRPGALAGHLIPGLPFRAVLCHPCPASQPPATQPAQGVGGRTDTRCAVPCH
jgi:hypothetical protein